MSYVLRCIYYYQVDEAREMLSAIDSHVINLVVCRQAGRALLSKQVSIVTDMIREGLLSEIDANKFLYLVNIDHARLAERAAKEFRYFDTCLFFLNLFNLFIFCVFTFFVGIDNMSNSHRRSASSDTSPTKTSSLLPP